MIYLSILLALTSFLATSCLTTASQLPVITRTSETEKNEPDADFSKANSPDRSVVQYRPAEVAKLKTELVGTYVWLHGFSGNTPFKNWERVKILNVDFDDHNDTFGSAEYTLTVQTKNKRSCFVAYDLARVSKVNLIKTNWSKEVVRAIQESSLIIGMTKEQIILSVGEPETVNKTVTNSGTKEQWVYGHGNYVYVINGLLSAIQTSH